MIDFPLWFRILAGLLVGLALGSFVTMLSYRLPRRLSIVLPPSQCPQCHANLRPRDLVPVFSWLVYGGRCSQGGAPIGQRYIIMEIVTAILSVAAFVAFGFSLVTLIALIGIVALITLSIIVIERERE